MGESCVAAYDVTMAGIPGDVITIDGVRELNHPDTAFDEASGEQAPFGVFTWAVEVEGGLGFLTGVKCFGDSHLHSESHFHGLNGSFELLVLNLTVEVHLI